MQKYIIHILHRGVSLRLVEWFTQLIGNDMPAPMSEVEPRLTSGVWWPGSGGAEARS